jgi:polysaccharide deacetylase 2 family uncharacterized protein YibQ
MFAKPKTAPDTAPRFNPRIRSRSGGGSDTLQGVLDTLKKPYVAPSLAAGALAIALVAFLNLAGDPDAGSPTVRITLDRPKPITAHVNDGDPAAQALTMDGQGQFSDGFDDGSNAADTASAGAPVDTATVITLPGDAAPSAATTLAAPASPLVKAPIAGLFQTTTNGPLPNIGPNGMAPASAYARPFRSDGRPMVALIVGGLGLNPATTKQAIEQLPAAVTLSFVPYTANLQTWIDQARAAGHEVMIDVPMQPVNYPDNDPGPQTLLANARNDDLTAHMLWALSRCTGYFAVTNYQGAAFFKDKPGFGTFLSTLKARGIGFIDDGQARDVQGAWARATADRVVDNQISAQAILAQLSGLESTAKTRGQALGTGMAFPVTLAVAMKWTGSLDGKGIQLAPASAMMHQ